MHEHEERREPWWWDYFATAAAFIKVPKVHANVSDLRMSELALQAYQDVRAIPKTTAILNAEHFVKETLRKHRNIGNSKIVRKHIAKAWNQAYPRFRVVRTEQAPTASASEIAVKAAELAGCVHGDADTQRWLAEQIQLLVQQHVRLQTEAIEEEATNG